MKCLLSSLVATFLVGSLIAQNDMIANVNMQFRFSNPGARSLGMGGAFVGLADDHTVLFANPAGLTRIRQRTFSVEVSSVQDDYPIPFYGGTIDQTGIQDLEFNLNTREFPETSAQVPFFSIIFPGEKLNWGFFYARQADMGRQFSTESVVIPDVPFDIRPVGTHQNYYFYPTQNQLDMSLQNWGFSLGWAISDRLSVGGTLSAAILDYKGSTHLQLPAFQEDGLQFLEPLFGETIATISANGKETRLSGILGMLFRPNDRFGFGLTYQYYPTYDYDYEVQERTLFINPPALGDFQVTESGTSEFHVPDHAAVGVSMMASEAFLISLEIKRVFYSELVEGYKHFFDQNGNDQQVDDATEYHAGCEYFFLNAKFPFSVRFGYWFEPYHALENQLADTQIIFRDTDGNLGVRNAVFLQRFSQDLDHLSAGFGFGLGQNFQLDMAMDWSDQSRVISASGTYRF